MERTDSVIIRLLDQISVLVSNKTTQHHTKIAHNLRLIADDLEGKTPCENCAGWGTPTGCILCGIRCMGG